MAIVVASTLSNNSIFSFPARATSASLFAEQFTCQRSNLLGRVPPIQPGKSVTRHRASVGISCQVATAQGKARSPRRENVPGEFYVDHTCIDCDTCRWMAPDVYSRVGNMSAVHQQPQTEDERMKALQALLACPTASIHTAQPPADIGKVHASFPLPVAPSLPGIFHCGYHSKHSYGATSYFILRPAGNIMVDSPRYTEQLARKLEEMGGVQYMFLTHRDDVADHKRWAARFKCVRIIHEDEVNADTMDAEMKLRGTGPWNLGEDVDLIHTPGHTEGCVCLLLRERQVLFSGDHLAYTLRNGGLSIFRRVNWYSVEKQLESVKKLINVDFLWLLPGHGRRYHFERAEQRKQMLTDLVEKESGNTAR